jgi:hypothetical protein
LVFIAQSIICISCSSKYYQFKEYSSYDFVVSFCFNFKSFITGHSSSKIFDLEGKNLSFSSFRFNSHLFIFPSFHLSISGRQEQQTIITWSLNWLRCWKSENCFDGIFSRV